MLKRIIDFLQEIGIDVIEATLDDENLLPGLDINEGKIVLDRSKLKYPGDLLHEAGHVAVTEEQWRPIAGTPRMSPHWPDAGDEIAAMLWSYAALRHLHIPLEVVFHPNGYKGESEWIMEQYCKGKFIGLYLLEWMGLCYGPEKAKEVGVPAFPHMIKWLR